MTRRATPTIAALALAVACGHVAVAAYWPRAQKRRTHRRALSLIWARHGITADTAWKLNDPVLAKMPSKPLADAVLDAVIQASRSVRLAFRGPRS